MKKLLIFLFSLFLQFTASATPSLKVAADSAYMKENYQEAASLYEKVLEEGYSPEIYYNLGNCYYRLEKIGPSVLNYERALLLSPGNGDIRHNLELARSKTLDKISPLGEIFIVTWYKEVINWFSVDQWAALGIICFIFVLIMLCLYLFSKVVLIRKLGFYSSIVFILICILSNFFAWNQKHILINRSTAVVMSTSVNVKSTPSENGTDLFVIHEGTKVTIIDPTMKGWKEIRLDDGKKGWIPTGSIEEI